MPARRVSVSLKYEEYNYLNTLATRKGFSVTEMVNRIVKKWIDNDRQGNSDRSSKEKQSSQA